MKKIFPVILVLLMVISFSALLFYSSKKNAYFSATESLNNAQKLADSKFKKVYGAYAQRNNYLSSLLQSSRQEVFLKSEIAALNAALAITPYDIEKIEAQSSKLNQKIVNEILLFYSKKKSTLFTAASQIKSLEQYDRFIDIARNEYSDWTFEYVSKKTTLEKSVFFPSNVKSISYFKIDHLIRSAAK